MRCAPALSLFSHSLPSLPGHPSRMDIRKFMTKKTVAAAAPAEETDAGPAKARASSLLKDATKDAKPAGPARTLSMAGPWKALKSAVVLPKSAGKARAAGKSPFSSAQHALLSRSVSAPAGRPKAPSPASSAPSSPRAAAEAADSSDSASPSPDRLECGVLPLRSYPVPSAQKGTGRVIIAAGSVIDFSGDGHKAAIVNAANERGLGGGGVDGAINRAGGDRLTSARRALPVLDDYGTRIPTGSARCGNSKNSRLKRRRAFRVHAFLRRAPVPPDNPSPPTCTTPGMPTPRRFPPPAPPPADFAVALTPTASTASLTQGDRCRVASGGQGEQQDTANLAYDGALAI